MRGTPLPPVQLGRLLVFGLDGMLFTLGGIELGVVGRCTPGWFFTVGELLPGVGPFENFGISLHILGSMVIERLVVGGDVAKPKEPTPPLSTWRRREDCRAAVSSMAAACSEHALIEVLSCA
jgi:hypothetical protein